MSTSDPVDDLLREDLNDKDINSGNEAFEDVDDLNEEAGIEQTVKVEPKKRSVRHPRPRLTVDTLKSNRGIHTLENHFHNIKFCGKHNEKKDLDEIMRRMKHWAHRMYPSHTFDDILTIIERLGKKKPLQLHMNRYRQGTLELEQNQNVSDNLDVQESEEPFDEFDALLGEQIAISKLVQPSAPSSDCDNTSFNSEFISTPQFHGRNTIPASTPISETSIKPKLTSEQMFKIAENRKLAQERLRAKREKSN